MPASTSQDFSFPNGIVTAFYGAAASCEKCILDANDYKAAQARLRRPQNGRFRRNPAPWWTERRRGFFQASQGREQGHIAAFSEMDDGGR